MERTLHRVKLYGILAEEFEKDFIEIYAGSAKEIFRALSSRFGDKFTQLIIANGWHLVQGQKTGTTPKEEDTFLGEGEVELPYLQEELHIFPAVIGAGGRGVGQIILGVVLIVIAVVLVASGVGAPVGGGIIAGLTAGGLATAVAVAGVAAILGGVMALFTKPPTMGDYSQTGTDQRLSFIFNGAVNNTEQGVPVPLVYGEHLAGSTVISAGMDVEQL